MAALIALAAIGLFGAGVTHGNPRRGDRGHPPGGENLTLTSEATDRVTRAGRRLTGLGVRGLHHSAAAGRETTLV